ncbi:PREDICTED: hepatic triacylglycerol lipase isoform X5 [Cercocebus atys]|uniref:hepatic triacylglycerol lipase isoform X5 n=1 Tax=Cercocebus atys TaxID=9531 RepID=UPI0005F50D87|nr:PREDICTED: hepatic triacylglycerol lipase isoform X5 [Cercocebus atys]
MAEKPRSKPFLLWGRSQHYPRAGEGRRVSVEKGNECDPPSVPSSGGRLTRKLDLADGGRAEVSAGPASERGASGLDHPGPPPLHHRRPQYPPRGQGGRGSSPVAGGLDAAGPLFEGSSPSNRLSPDDANFVDAIHTFTREHMGLSVGIKQPIGHYDFYPNGGSFQPGCHFLELYRHIAKHGLNAITQTIKCSHERSVHLFIDSLLHAGTQSVAYLCSDMDSFSQGLCLSCKKGRCNTLGYHVRQEPRSKSKKLFLVTRAQSPFKVYHYQFKIQFINQTETPIQTTFTMSLLGTKEKMQKIAITLGKGIASNKTYSFLITLDVDIGELIMIKFKWESSAVWANVWNTVQTIIPWSTGPRHPGLVLKMIRVKAGETQQRMTFCSENTDDLQLRPTQEKIFVKCEIKSKTSKQKIR